MKIRTIITMLTVALSMIHQLIGDQSERVGDYRWRYSQNTIENTNCWDESVTVTGVSSPSGAITIPATLGGKPVTRIGYQAFYKCTGLTSVTIPNSVTSIEGEAFYGCTGLTSVTIPDSVTSIGKDAFAGCGNALYNTTKIPGVKLVDGWAVGYTSPSLLALVLKEVRGIGAWAFYNCDNLKSVTIPASVKGIGIKAFHGCDALATVTISGPVASMGYDAFSYCPSLRNLDLGDKILTIGDSAFFDCNELRNVSIPDSVTNIDTCAFYGCSNLISVTMGTGVKEVGWCAFGNCTGLKAVHARSLLGWSQIDFSAHANPLAYAGKLYVDGRLVTRLDLPDTITKIGSYTFPNYKLLTSVETGDGVLSIGWGAFRDCTSLSHVKLGANLKTIDGYAFGGCSLLTTLIFPDRLESIGEFACWGCNLDEVFLPKSVTELGTGAFYGCRAMEGLVVGENMAEIVELDFAENSNLRIVRFRGAPPRVLVFVKYGAAIPAAIAGSVIGDRPSSYGVRDSSLPSLEGMSSPNMHIGDRNPVFKATPHYAVGYYRHRYAAEWEAALDADGTWQGLKMFEMEGDEVVITLECMGGELPSRYWLLESGYSPAGRLPTPVRPGYRFAGWYTAPTGGAALTSSMVPRGDVTYYARWTTGSTPERPSVGVGTASNGASGSFTPSGGYGAVKAQTWVGAAYRGNDLVGTVTLKLGKADKKGVYKVSGAIVSLDGKKHTIQATGVARSSGVVAVGNISVKGLGKLTLKLGANGFTGTTSNGLTLRTANVSSLPSRTMTFNVSPYPTSINKVPVKTAYLPLGQKVSSNGKKVTTPKTGKLNYKNGRFFVSAGGEGNPSALRLNYKPKTGQIKGSFNVYTFNGRTLKKYSARVSGAVADGVARMVVTVGRINFGTTLYATLK